MKTTSDIIFHLFQFFRPANSLPMPLKKLFIIALLLLPVFGQTAVAQSTTGTLAEQTAYHTAVDCTTTHTYSIPDTPLGTVTWTLGGGTWVGGTPANTATQVTVTWDVSPTNGRYIQASYQVSAPGEPNGIRQVYTEVFVTIGAPDAGTISTVGSVCYGGDPATILELTPPSYGTDFSWQESTDDTNWSNISGADQEDFTPPTGMTQSMYYRRGVTVCGNVTSWTPSTFVEVYDEIDPGTVSVTFDCENGTASLTGTAAMGGDDTNGYTYVWQTKTVTGGTWTTTSSSITSLSEPMLFRRLASSDCNESEPSNIVTVAPEELVEIQSLDLTQEYFCYEEQAFVKLADSQNDVTYELYQDDSPTGSTLTGNGGPLTWNVSASGKYEVVAVSGTSCGAIFMTGEANISAEVPQVYDVTGGGSICPGITSNISLSGSDLDVKYYLELDDVVLLSTEMDGTGYPLDWCSIDVAGTYSVVAKQGDCAYMDMNNLSDPVAEIGLPQTPVVSNNYTATLNGTVNLSTQAETGVTYYWYDTNGQELGTGSTFSLTNVDSIVELVVVADNGGCSTSTKITAGYVVVSVPTVQPTLISACGHYYLQKSGSPAINHKWYWQGKDSEGREQLIDASLYDLRVVSNGNYYLRSFNEQAGIWADQPLTVPVNISDPTTIKPTDCSDITAMEVASTPVEYTTGKINYVRTYDAYRKGMTAAEVISETEADRDDVLRATQYIDGLGRPLETVTRSTTPAGKDMVQYMLYDEYGRPAKQYLPYAATDASGDFKLDPFGGQEDFYHGATGITAHFPDEDVLYGETLFERSPLNRAKLSTAPGDAWTGNRVGVGANWLVNTTAEGIRKWTIATNPQTTATYQEGELYVTVTTDEEGHEVKEFTNAKGQVILKQVQKGDANTSGHSAWLNTYYVYNTYNQLAFVLPPRAVELLEANSWNWANAGVSDLVFTYTYDGRNRMITKKVPGSDRVGMVYDKMDRLILTQDANQRAIDQWTFTKYDALNRPVLTGFITSSVQTLSAMQAAADAWGVYHVSREPITSGPGIMEANSITLSTPVAGITVYRATEDVTFLSGFDSSTEEFEVQIVPALSSDYTYFQGYNDATFPVLAQHPGFEVNSVNYYDDYDFTTKSWDNSNVVASLYADGVENAIEPAQYENVSGMATGSRIRVLGTDDWLESVMFYDNRGRVVQTQGENHLGGTDITVTQYDFSGRVLNTHTTHENPQASANSSTEILKTYEYDRTGRVLYVKQKIGSAGSVKTLVANTYNELGELESKALGTDPQNTSNPLETLDYDYNVRGWLKSVNGDYVANGTGSHYFGMDLSYDFGFESNRLNGNIAGVKWRTRSSPKMRAYGFDYDPVNRLLKADYHQKDATVETSWSKTLSDFSTSYGYDANGNILNLTRKGVVAGTITTIDQLTYDYGAGLNLAGTSNQLMAVYDPQGDLGQGDFKDGNVGSDDYSYDANGNMKDDMNKGISNITYNHLNLPVTVSFGSTKTITYLYDAAGIKLAKVVDDNGSITTTDYAAGFIYENDELQHFAHEEGRMRKNNAGNLVYDYFIKDHLGNTRMTLTEEQVVTVYEATMETEYEAFEEELFLNLDNTRTTFLAANTTTDSNITVDEVASLNGSDPDRRVGPAKLLAVSPGDQVDLAVMAYYEGTIGTNSPLTEGETLITTAVAAAFGGSSTGNTEQQAIYGLFDDINYNLLVGSGATSTSQPRAYLNYLFFDQDFKYIGAKSGYKQVSAAAQQDVNDPNKPKELLTGTITVDQGGYVYVYLSNESQTDFDVYFDDLRVTHSKGAILQEDHYYPFGMSINALSSSAALSKPNKYKFNGNEEQTEFNLNLYDFNARFYDGTLGRFMNIDPLADHPKQINLSPYQFGANNPVYYVDPDGRCFTKGENGEYVPCADGESGDTRDGAFGNNWTFGENGWQLTDGNTAASVEPSYTEETPNGSPEYYINRYKAHIAKYGTRPPDYYLGYGHKYILRFTKVLRDKLSKEGQEWLDKTAVELQVLMEEGLRESPGIELDNDDFQKFAFESHVPAYTNGDNLFSLGLANKVKILFTPDLKDSFGSQLGLAQVYAILNRQSIFNSFINSPSSLYNKTRNPLYLKMGGL